jgi:hypothetical protein
MSIRIYLGQAQLTHWKGSGGGEQDINLEAIPSDDLEYVVQVPKELNNGSCPSNEGATNLCQLRQTCTTTNATQNAGVRGQRERTSTCFRK